MTSDLDSKERGTGERAIARSYQIKFWIGMLSYVIVLTAALIWGGLDGDSPWRFAWAIAPVIPMLWIVVAMLRYLSRIDDYQRLLLLKGLAVGFAVAMLSAITVGFLGMAGLEFEIINAGWIVFSLGMLGWGLASTATAKR